MKHIWILFTLLLVTAACFPYIEEYESLAKFVYSSADGCAYDNWQSHIVEGIASPGYNIYAPYDRQLNGFGSYVAPSADQLTQWEEIILAFIAGDLTGADELIEQYEFPYEVVVFHDSDTGNTYHMLRELVNPDYYDDNATADTYDDEHGSFNRGWGLYIKNTEEDAKPILVTVPHPNDDYITPAFGIRTFLQWNAEYLLISGVGREVMWNDDGYGYTNSKSISDPTRHYDHTFNTAYRRFCDNIREDTGERELCVQLHSYDWNAHLGYNNCQIAAGNWNRDYPCLPIRDLSYDHKDFINATPYIVHPENTIGIHDPVTIEEFYTVYYTSDGFDYVVDGDTIQVPNEIDLPGYQYNRQMQYTISGQNVYEQHEPFVHIEFDELPSCYPHTTNYWRWFNAFDPLTLKYNLSKVHDRAIQYYQPIFDAIGSTLDDYFEMDDGEFPTAPENLTTTTSGFDSITLKWDRSSAYDFYSYQILYSTEPLENGTYSTFSRSNRSTMAGQAINSVTIGNLEANTTYYMAIRAVDFNNHTSALSEEITTFTGPALIDDYAAYGRSESVDIQWIAEAQSNNAGFIIDRATDPEGPYETISSWETNMNLAGSTEEDVSYSYVDYDIDQRLIYYYRVHAEHTDGTIAWNNDYREAQPQYIHQLNVYNASQTVSDSVRFGKNAYASDSWDSHFDMLNTDVPVGNYVQAEFYEQYWDANYRRLFQEIHNDYDEETWLNTWTLRVRTNQTGQQMYIELPEMPERNGEKMYLRNLSTGSYTNLAESSLQFTASNTDWISFTLYWGDLQPNITVGSMQNRYYQANDEVAFNWSTSYPVVVESIKLCAVSGTDTLVVANSLNGGATSYNWTVPDLTWMTDCKLLVRAYFEDGSFTDYESEYRFGIVPSSFELGIGTGWKVSSNPITNAAMSPGDNTELYQWNPQNGFTSDDTYSFGTPYWTYGFEYWGLYMGGISFYETDWESSLREGWNFVPNPHYGPLPVTDISILVNGYTYTYTEAVRNGYIAKPVYVYRDGYRLVNEIMPQESFFMFCHIPDLGIKLKPFAHNPKFEYFRDAWELQLIASQGDEDKDIIIMGANEESTVDFDEFLDTPKPPDRPAYNAVNLQILQEEDFSPYPEQKFYQEFKRPFTYLDLDVQTWDIQLELKALSEVTLKLDRSQFMDEHSVLVNLGSYFFNMTEVDSVSFFPNQLTLNGTVRIYNQFMNNDDDALQYKQIFTNYPNPFNPETTFKYSLPKQSEVELTIYNIKGQRVKKFVSDVQDAGVHDIVWRGQDDRGKKVSSGIYFCKLEINGKTSKTRKVLLLK